MLRWRLRCSLTRVKARSLRSSNAASPAPRRNGGLQARGRADASSPSHHLQAVISGGSGYPAEASGMARPGLQTAVLSPASWIKARILWIRGSRCGESSPPAWARIWVNWGRATPSGLGGPGCPHRSTGGIPNLTYFVHRRKAFIHDHLERGRAANPQSPHHDYGDDGVRR